MFEFLGILSFLCTLVMLVISINPKWITRGKLQKRKYTLVTALVMFVLFVTFAVNDPSANTKPTLSPDISTSTTTISPDAGSTKQQNPTKAPEPITPKATASSPVSSPATSVVASPTTTNTPAVAPNTSPTPTAAYTAVNTPATPAVSTPSPVPKQTNQDVIVYITKTGKKYHRDGCRYLSRSKIAISLKDAESEGYTPCSVCDPPQ